jgi:multisite-specific tRNA:(cytosine-C5)-methyltransferase
VRAPAPDPDADPDASTNGHRNLYITNDLVKLLVTHNDYNRIRLTCAGTKVFTKQEAGRGGEAQFRVLGEALPLVIPYTDPATIVEGDMGVLTVLVEKAYPLIGAFPEGAFRTALMERGAFVSFCFP